MSAVTIHFYTQVSLIYIKSVRKRTLSVTKPDILVVGFGFEMAISHLNAVWHCYCHYLNELSVVNCQ